MTNSKSSDPDKMIAVELPAKYWVVVMTTLQNAISTYVQPEIAELRQNGTDVNKLPPEQITALVGPVTSLGVITQTMHEAGYVTDEANATMGYDAIRKSLGLDS